MTRAGRLPARGEVVPGPGDFEIEVLDADPRRLKKVRITRGPSGARASAMRGGATRRPTHRAASTPKRRPARDRRDAHSRGSRERRMRWCSPGAGGAPRSRFAAGAVSVLALAPVNAWPVLFVTSRSWSG